jgi:RNA polymerase sigma factor (TIGR02999 family)
LKLEPLRNQMTAPKLSQQEVTQLLLDWGQGDQSALDKLMPLVYGELRKMARQYLNREHPGHTLQTTDLIHETYLKLVDQRRVHWQNKAQFFGVSAQLMRRILVDRARGKKRMKRGGGATVLTLQESVVASQSSPLDLVAFDVALTRLAEIDQRKAQVVELRFFGGFSVDEAAEFLKVSNITIMRESKMAKAWLHRALSDES